MVSSPGYLQINPFPNSAGKHVSGAGPAGGGQSWSQLPVCIVCVDMSVSFLSAKAEANFKETLRAMMAAGVAQVSSY